MWIIDFPPDRAKSEAAGYPRPYEYVRQNVKLDRDKVRNDRERKLWWLHARPVPDLRAAAWTLAALFAVKQVSKFFGVYFLMKRYFPRDVMHSTLLMSTGLTFGTISALFGLQNHIIDQSQYTILVTVVILSAFVPTLIAQKFFQPTIETMVEWGKIYSERNNKAKPRQPAQTEK